MIASAGARIISVNGYDEAVSSVEEQNLTNIYLDQFYSLGRSRDRHQVHLRCIAMGEHHNTEQKHIQRSLALNCFQMHGQEGDADLHGQRRRETRDKADNNAQCSTVRNTAASANR